MTNRSTIVSPIAPQSPSGLSVAPTSATDEKHHALPRLLTLFLESISPFT
jgi:hypothetical protein